MTGPAVQLRRIIALARRDLRIEVSYHFQLLLRVFGALLSLVTFFFIGELVGEAPELGGYTGGYFEFALIGLVVMSLSLTCVSAVASSIKSAQASDTLEILLSTATPLGVLMGGTLVVPLLFASVDAVLYLGLGWIVSHSGFSVYGLLVALPLLVLLLGTFAAVGIGSAAMLVLTKRGDPITNFATQASNILAGAMFPVAMLPEVLQGLARVVPAFYGLRGIRDALLGGAGFVDVSGDLLALLAFNVVMVPLALWALRRAIRVAKTTGTLGNQ